MEKSKLARNVPDLAHTRCCEVGVNGGVAFDGFEFLGGLILLKSE